MQPEQTQEQKQTINPGKKAEWIKEQKHVQSLITEVDELPCKLEEVSLVAGVDISFSGKYEDGACAGLLVYSVPHRKIVYEEYEYVRLKEPYVPGFLAFRELGPTLQLFRRLKQKKPELWPQVIMVDGNGILHKRQCGYASHLGVLLKTPSIGCAKTFFDIDGLHQSEVELDLENRLNYEGEHVPIVGKSGRVWCNAILSDQKQNKNIFVSVGTKISLASATKLVVKLLKYETPEPVRLVDKRSRQMIRKMTAEHYKDAKYYDMVYVS